MPEPVWLVYDGDCPFCAMSARMYRIRKAAGPLHIIDARQPCDAPVITEIAAAGLDLNKGIVVKYAGQLYHGPDALHLMAMLGSDNDFLNAINAWLFRSKAVARFLYPSLKAVRDGLLFIMGRRKL